jgi:hypothetical protein
MGVSGQRHAPTALYSPGKDARYPLYRRLGGPQSRSGHRLQKNPLPLPGIDVVTSKSKAVPLHAMEALRGRGGVAPTHSRPRH